jgi:hypothetical protein
MSILNVSSRKAISSSTPNESTMPVEKRGVSTVTGRPVTEPLKRLSRKARICS